MNKSLIIDSKNIVVDWFKLKSGNIINVNGIELQFKGERETKWGLTSVKLKINNKENWYNCKRKDGKVYIDFNKIV